ncbi:MAG: hypothetical protein ACYC26_13365, partial [Phycisphaerales bacterium]
MSSLKRIQVSDLHLDLKNYRTLPQKGELAAVKALLAINRDRFWALCESILTDNYYYNATPSANDKVAGLSAGFQGRAIVGSSACGGCGRRGRCAV